MFKKIGIAFIFTFLGKILAFFRVQQLAVNYGDEYWLDAFFIVFSVTSLFDVILISGAIGTTLVPLYLKAKSISVSKAERLYADIFSVLFTFFIFISFLLYFFSPDIAAILVKGNNQELLGAVEILLKVFCLFPLLSLLFQMPTIYNQANGKYQLSTLNPIVLNGGQLITIFVLVSFSFNKQHDVVNFLAIYQLCMFFCFFIQVYFHRPAMPKRFISFDFEVFKIFSVSVLPFIIFIAVEEVNLIVDQYFATALKEGSVSNLLYANRLVKIFGAIFVGSIVTVFYPKISRLLALGNLSEVKYISCLIIQFLAILTMPIVVIFFFFSKEVVMLLYGPSISSDVSDVLCFYSLLVFSGSIYLIQVRLVYAIGIGKVIIFFCISASVSNFILNFVLVDLFGVVGIAMSTALVSFLQILFFNYYLDTKSMSVFSKAMIINLIGHLVVLIILLTSMEYFFAVFIDEHWILSSSILVSIYFFLSIVFNRNLYVQLLKI